MNQNTNCYYYIFLQVLFLNFQHTLEAYLKKLSHSEAQLNQHYARNQRNIRLVQQKLARLLKTSRMKVNDLMHPGIEITIARDSKSFTRIYPPHSVKLDEGKITQKFNG